MYVIMAFISGCMVILSMIINSHLGKRIGVLQGTLVNYIIGSLFAIPVFIFSSNHANASFESLTRVPFWACLGGAIGVLVVAVTNVIIPKIPTIYSTLLLFIGQLFTAMFMDYLMGNSVSTGKIIGGLLILAGLTYNFKVDKRQTECSEQI